MKTNLSDHVEECRFCNWLKLVLSPQNSDFGWEEPSIKVHSKARYFNKKETLFPHIQAHDTSCPSQPTYSPLSLPGFAEKEKRNHTSAVHMIFVGLSKGSNYQHRVANKVSIDNMVNPLLVVFMTFISGYGASQRESTLPKTIFSGPISLQISGECPNKE